MNVFEFARIVELNRAILREGESLNVSHPCSFVPYNETDPASASTLERGPKHRQPVSEAPHV